MRVHLSLERLQCRYGKTEETKKIVSQNALRHGLNTPAALDAVDAWAAAEGNAVEAPAAAAAAVDALLGVV